MNGRQWCSVSGVLPWSAFLWVFALLAVPNEILGQTRVGSEFQVNTYTISQQTAPAVARSAGSSPYVI